MPDNNQVKILFTYFSDILDDYATETLPAEVVNDEYGYYQLKSLPFYAPKIAFDDTVWAEYKESEGMLIYRTTVRHSGNSTIHIVILDDEQSLDAVAAIFETGGSFTQKLNDRYFALSLPADIEYQPIKSRLDQLENEKILDYSESWLSEKHQYKKVQFQ